MKRFSLFPSLLLVGVTASFGAIALHAAGVTALHPSSLTSAEVGLATNASPTSVTQFSLHEPGAALNLTPVPAGEQQVDEDPADANADEPATEDDEEAVAPTLTSVRPANPVPQLPAGVTQNEQYESNVEKSAQLLKSMNDARGNEGLDLLLADADLEEVALVRATDLIENGYFDHYSPAGENAFAELGIRGIAYRLAGENLARNNYPEPKTVGAAFDGLMGSPGHRANILEPRFARAGVAVVKSGKVWYYVTVFAD